MKHCIIRFALIPLFAIFFIGCEYKQDHNKDPQVVSPAVAAIATPSPTPATATTATPMTTASTNGFDIQQAPIANPQLGAFPYVGLLNGYKKTNHNPNDNKDVAYDRFEFFDGVKLIPVEGRLMTIEAEGSGASSFEILKTYETLITDLGGVKVFSGEIKDASDQVKKQMETRHRSPLLTHDEIGLSVLRTPEKEIWVEAYFSTSISHTDRYFLTVVEKKKFEARAALIAAAEMKKELDAKGHVALYINFDFDKANIKPESQPIIEEILKLLQQNSDLNLTIEGHTDNIGAPEYNRRLSDARAKSVATSLVSRGIQISRLKTAGFGPDKPIADNSAEEGRAKNRRVELVRFS